MVIVILLHVYHCICYNSLSHMTAIVWTLRVHGYCLDTESARLSFGH